ncbi:MAG: ATP-binding protein [Solirubrobacteraceae bacterium]
MQSVTDSLSLTYRAAPSSVGLARAAMVEFAGRAGATRAEIDAIRLATSEAVTNAVVHAYRGAPGQIHVTATIAGPELWLLIADDGAGMEPEAHRPGLGLGLGLISRVCDEVRIVSRPSGGTEVGIRLGLAHVAQDSAPMAPGQLTVNAPAAGVAMVHAAPEPD